VNIPSGTGPPRAGEAPGRRGRRLRRQPLLHPPPLVPAHAHTKAGEYQFDGALIRTTCWASWCAAHQAVPLHRGRRAPRRRDSAGHRRQRAVPGSRVFSRSPAIPPPRGSTAFPDRRGGLPLPDTYSLPRGAGCSGVVHALVSRFQKAGSRPTPSAFPRSRSTSSRPWPWPASWRRRLAGPRSGRGSLRVPQPAEEEDEAADGPDGGLRAPALARLQMDHNIHKDDLSLQHPYNTYFIKGLPPGPNRQPGQAALEAALHPVACPTISLRLAQRPHARLLSRPEVPRGERAQVPGRLLRRRRG